MKKITVYTATATKERRTAFTRFNGKYDPVSINLLFGDCEGMSRRRAATYYACIMPNGDRPDAPEYYNDGSKPSKVAYGWISPNCGVIAANPMHGTYGEIVRSKEAATWVESLKAGDRIKVKGFGLWEVYIRDAGTWSEAPRLRKIR